MLMETLITVFFIDKLMERLAQSSSLMGGLVQSSSLNKLTETFSVVFFIDK